MKLLVLTALAAVPVALSIQSPHLPPLAADQYGAVYRTAKGMYFGLRTVEVVGRTADVDARVVWLDDGARFRVEAAVPVATFDSGNGRRDRHVAEILGAPEDPELQFRSEPTMLDAFRAALQRGDAPLPGHLRIRGDRVPVAFAIRLVGDAMPSVEGRLQGTFSALGVTVPDVGPVGLVAAPQDTLELFVRLPVDRIPGADRLLTDKRLDSAAR